MKKFRILKCGGGGGGDADESILTVSTDSPYHNHDYHESSNHHQINQRKSNVSIYRNFECFLLMMSQKERHHFFAFFIKSRNLRLIY